ncbi:hypothetical protein [Chromobacterium amazonense]|uniref:hypothetical protein n=1 Tax=Chromobacterium amazonense TaxID=1382803 RepID=UPI003F78CF8C
MTNEKITLDSWENAMLSIQQSLLNNRIHEIADEEIDLIRGGTRGNMDEMAGRAYD